MAKHGAPSGMSLARNRSRLCGQDLFSKHLTSEPDWQLADVTTPFSARRLFQMSASCQASRLVLKPLSSGTRGKLTLCQTKETPSEPRHATFSRGGNSAAAGLMFVSTVKD